MGQPLAKQNGLASWWSLVPTREFWSTGLAAGLEKTPLQGNGPLGPLPRGQWWWQVHSNATRRNKGTVSWIQVETKRG